MKTNFAICNDPLFISLTIFILHDLSHKKKRVTFNLHENSENKTTLKYDYLFESCLNSIVYKLVYRFLLKL